MSVASVKSQYPNEWADGRYAFKKNKGQHSNPFNSDERGRFKKLAWIGGYNEAKMEFIDELKNKRVQP